MVCRKHILFTFGTKYNLYILELKKKTGGKGGRGSKKGAKKSLTPIPAASESTTERNNQQQPVSSYLETIDETISHIISMVCGKRTADCLTVEVSSKRTEATTTGAVGETVAAAAAAEPPSSCHYGLRSSTLRVRKTAQQVLLSGSYDQSSSSAIPSMPKPSSRYAPYTTARSGKAIKKAEASKTAEISLENELRGFFL
jgi:hypothetical protein